MLSTAFITMSYKKSARCTEENKETWTKNLVQFQAPSRRGHAAVQEASLSERSRMPLKSHVIGRFKFLEASTKGRKERIRIIAEELSETLNSLHVSDQAICAKLQKALKLYEWCWKEKKRRTG